MAAPDRDTVYTTDGTTNRTTYTRESSATGWFVGIIVALALLAIGYLVFSANSTPSTNNVDVNNTPAVTAPSPGTDTAPMPEAPATGTEAAPMTEAPAAPADAAPAAPADTAPAAPADSTAPATETPAPATPAAPAQ